MKRDAADAAPPPTARLPWSAPWTATRVRELFEPMVGERRRARIREVVEQRLDSVTVLMDAPHDPHNGAAVLRSCDAFGVQRVHVAPRDEEFLVSSAVAKGTERWVETELHRSPEHAVQTLTERGFELVAAHPKGTLAPARLADIPRVCIVVGNEHDGIREALLRAARHTVSIPMRGYVESLNVSVSAAILLAFATANRPGDLRPDEREQLYAKGLFQTVARAQEILAASDPHRPAGYTEGSR